jgi:hypothetical protein
MLLNNLILLHLYYKYLKNIFVIMFVMVRIRIMFGYIRNGGFRLRR